MQGQAQDRNKALLAKQNAIRAISEEMGSQVELNVHPMFETALKGTASALSAPMACLHLADAEKNALRLVESLNMDPVWGRAWERLTLSGSAPPAVAIKEVRVMELSGEAAPRGLGGLVTGPVLGGGLCLGAVSLLWPSPARPPHDPDRAVFMETIGHLLGLAIEHAGLVSELLDSLNEVMQLKAKEEERNRELSHLNQQLTDMNRRLEELSNVDGLTQAYNHHYMHQRLEEEVTRSLRLKHPLSMLMLDIDHFKRVNDKLGHPAGDEALKLFVSLIKQNVRQVDVVGRVGGEEFMVLLLDCDLNTAVKVANKLRETVENQSRLEPFLKLNGFTVSIGAAELKKGMEPDALINLADRALYQAKQNGRNRVEAAV